MSYAIIEISASGDNIIVPAVAGKFIRCYSYLITSAGAVSTKFKDGTGLALTGTNWSTMTANGGTALGGNVEIGGYFQTTVGSSLILNLSASVQVGGHITYAYY